YERAEEWTVIGPLLGDQLAVSFIAIQLVLGSMVPIILLGIVVLMSPYLTDQIRNTLCFSASLLLLIQVFAMRWNVVIGGQTFSKSLRGFRENEIPGLFEKEGIALAILIVILPLLFIALFNRILPVFEQTGDEPAEAAGAGAR
ncbi:MAG: NrfD/PsrC family molybdoenzyme membrane anchor subunit, partial [Planctomycetota bacterium]